MSLPRVRQRSWCVQEVHPHPLRRTKTPEQVKENCAHPSTFIAQCTCGTSLPTRCEGNAAVLFNVLLRTVRLLFLDALGQYPGGCVTNENNRSCRASGRVSHRWDRTGSSIKQSFPKNLVSLLFMGLSSSLCPAVSSGHCDFQTTLESTTASMKVLRTFIECDLEPSGLRATRLTGLDMWQGTQRLKCVGCCQDIPPIQTFIAGDHLSPQRHLGL